MNKDFKVIEKFLEEREINYDYNSESEYIGFVVAENSSGEKLYECIDIYKNIFRSYIFINIELENELLDENIKNRISEYLHRVNSGMIRGNFEYDVDTNTIRFKNIFEKSLTSNAEYIKENISIPVTMFNKYVKGLYDIINTDTPPKDIVNKIEQDD